MTQPRTAAQVKELQAKLDELLARKPQLRKLSFRKMNALIQKLDAQLLD